MRCTRCGSTQVNIQAVTETTFKRKKKSLLYWLTIGWLIEPMLWVFLTLPKLIYELFKPHRFTAKSKKHNSDLSELREELEGIKLNFL